MHTFPEKRIHDVNETTMVPPQQQHPASLSLSEAETASGNFSFLFLANFMNAATALTEQVTETVAAATTFTVEGLQRGGSR